MDASGGVTIVVLGVGEAITCSLENVAANIAKGVRNFFALIIITPIKNKL